jgi:hypothetical protein
MEGLSMHEAKLEPGVEKIPRAEAISMAKEIIKLLGVKYVDPDTVDTNYKYVAGVGIPVGSIRRQRPEVGDVDIVVTAPIDKEKLRASSKVSLITGQDKQTNFTYDDGKNVRKVNLFSFTDPDTFGAALLHATGPGNYNKRIRFVVPSRGFGKLSQLGLFDKNGKVLPSRTEAEVQQTLKITQREPTERDGGSSKKKKEVKEGLARRLPFLHEVKKENAMQRYERRERELPDSNVQMQKPFRTKSGLYVWEEWTYKGKTIASIQYYSQDADNPGKVMRLKAEDFLFFMDRIQVQEAARSLYQKTLDELNKGEYFEYANNYVQYIRRLQDGVMLRYDLDSGEYKFYDSKEKFAKAVTHFLRYGD